jgi:hypothetical protein
MADLDTQVVVWSALHPQFAEHLERAAAYIASDPASSLTKSRIVAEKLVVELFTAEMGHPPRKPLLGDILTDPQFTGRIERRMLSRLHAIRDMGNLGPHGEHVERSDAERVLWDLFEVLDWYARRSPGGQHHHSDRPLSEPLRSALARLGPDTLLQGDPALAANRQAARELLQEVSQLVERFETQYDEMVSVLSEAGYATDLYGSAGRVPRDRLLRANRKLVTVANDMRAIYRGIRSRFTITPETVEALDRVTRTCCQLAVAEDFLVIQGVQTAGEFRFDLKEQEWLLQALDGRGLSLGVGPNELQELGSIRTGRGALLLEEYHSLLLELHNLKLQLREQAEAVYRS